MATGVRSKRIGTTARARGKAALAAAAGVLALGTAALVVPTAFADDETDRLGGPLGLLPVDEALAGVIEIGEIVERTETLGYDDASPVVELHEPGASYVKVHFERLLLDAGDHVTVSSPDGTESYRYDDSAVDEWATSITGDTAIVELHRAAGGLGSSALGAIVDKTAFGFPEEVVDRLVDDRAARSRPEESVCTSDDKRPSPCYEQSHPDIVARTGPVARLLIDGTVLCTGFRVGDRNRMLTNNHCMSENWEAPDTEVWFDYDCVSCDRDDATRPVKVAGSRVVKTSESLDYTLFTVDDFARVREFGSLTLATRPTMRGEALYIPQHPAGRPTEIAVESSVDGGDCVVEDPIYDGYVPGSDVSYYCDTEFGSSGSPVISRDTHEVIALHHFGGCPNSGVSAYLIEREIRPFV